MLARVLVRSVFGGGRGYRWTGIVLPACISIAGCGGSEATADVHVTRTLQPIQGGQFDPDHTSVVGMFTVQGQYAGLCTGTLIAPNLVLTARHCVAPILSGERVVVCGQSPFGQPYPPADIYFTSDDQIRSSSDGGIWYGGGEVRVPSEGNDTCGFDVALVILAGAGVSESVTRPYVPRIDISPERGEVYQAVGYGITGSARGSGNRMVRGGLRVQCSPGTCASGVEDTEFLGETGVCQGDSGGPSLDRDGKVIGVVSRGRDPCDSPVYGSVSAWKDWIVQVAGEAAQLGGYPPAFWVTTGRSDPDPAGGAGAAGAGGGTGSGGTTAGDAQGTSCSATEACPSGYQCFLPSGESSAYCAAECSGPARCGAGTSCEALGDASMQLCLNQGGQRRGSDGCSLARPSQPSTKPASWLVGMMLAAAGAFRRRNRARIVSS